MNTEATQTEIDDNSSAFRTYNEYTHQLKLDRINRFKDQLFNRAVIYEDTDVPNVATAILPDGTEIYFSLVPSYNKTKYRLAGTNKWKDIGTNNLIMMCKGDAKPYKSTGNKFKFGRHKDKTIEEVYQTDKQYLEWCMNANVDEGLKNKILEVVVKYEDEKGA